MKQFFYDDATIGVVSGEAAGKVGYRSTSGWTSSPLKAVPMPFGAFLGLADMPGATLVFTPVEAPEFELAAGPERVWAFGVRA